MEDTARINGQCCPISHRATLPPTASTLESITHRADSSNRGHPHGLTGELRRDIMHTIYGLFFNTGTLPRVDKQNSPILSNLKIPAWNSQVRLHFVLDVQYLSVNASIQTPFLMICKRCTGVPKAIPGVNKVRAHILMVSMVPVDVPRADKVHLCLLKDHKAHMYLLRVGKVPACLRVNKVCVCLLRTLNLLLQDSQVL